MEYGATANPGAGSALFEDFTLFGVDVRPQKSQKLN
jgi:hypothetical protein